MKMYKSIVLLLLVATVYTEIITQRTCSPGFVQINSYCVQSDTNTVGLTASNDPCTSFDENGLCTQTNTNTQPPTNEVPPLTTSNPNTFSQSFVPNVAASSSPQNSLSSLNPLFTFYGSQSPQFSSQSAPTSTSFPSSAAAAANNGNVAASSLISSENPTYQAASSSFQNNQFVATTSNTQNIPMMVKSGPSQTNTPQVPSFGSTKSLTLTPQISQLLFRGGNPPSTSSNTNVNTNSPSRTNSPSQNTQTFNANQDILGTSSLSKPQSGNTPSDINSNSVSTSSSSSTPTSPSVNQDINPFNYCAKFNPKTLLCEQCAKGFRVNPRFNKTNPNQAPYCLALDPLCKTYSTDLSRCATCYVGYEISNKTCIISKTALANCQTANANKTACTKCYKGFYVDPTTKQCKARNPQCATYTNNTSNECATCYAGYGVVKGDCVLIQNTIANTSNTNNNPNARESSNPVFFKSPSIFYYQAASSLVTSSLETAPAPVADTTDLYCAKFNNGVCVQCNFRAYFKGKVCQPVSDQCQTFNQVTGSCNSCFKGFDLQSNGTCLKGNDLCMTRNASTGLCLNCYLGYTLSADGKCK